MVSSEYLELRHIQEEAREFLSGNPKPYGTITDDGKGCYHIVVNTGKAEWRDIADEVRVLCHTERFEGKHGGAPSKAVREELPDMVEEETQAREIVAGLEKAANDPKGRLPVQPQRWQCLVEERVMNRVRNEITNHKGGR